MPHHAGVQQDKISTERKTHAQWQYHQHKNQKEKGQPYLSECQRGSKYETEQQRGRKGGEKQKKQKGKCLRRKSLSLLTGDRLGKKRQAHRDSFLSTTVLCLKCRNLCTKIQLYWPQHPKEQTREQKKGTNSGEKSKKRKAKYRTERVNLQGEKRMRAINKSVV